MFIPLFHRECPLANDSRVLDALRRLSISPVVLEAHNGVLFDSVMIWVKLGIWLKTSFDTMLADGPLDENRPKGLKYLTNLFVPGLANYEDEMRHSWPKDVKVDDRDFELHLPLDVLARYGCADPDATHQLALYQRQQLPLIPSIQAGVPTANGVPVEGPFPTMLEFFERHIMKDAQAAARSSMAGLAYDDTRRQLFSERCSRFLAEAKADLENDPAMGVFSDYLSSVYAAEGRFYRDGDYLYSSRAHRLQGIAPIYHIGVGELVDGAHEALTSAKVLKKRDRTPYATGKKVFTEQDVIFGPTKTEHVRVMLVNVLQAEIEKRTQGGEVATDEEVLSELKHSHPWVKKLLEFRHASKVESTYGRPFVRGEYEHVSPAGKTSIRTGWIRDDNLVHPEFRLTGGNDTGRDTDDGLRS